VMGSSARPWLVAATGKRIRRLPIGDQVSL
jgi:hypothetical protein